VHPFGIVAKLIYLGGCVPAKTLSPRNSELESMSRRRQFGARYFGQRRTLVRNLDAKAAYTGLRAAELTGLRVRDLNLKAGHVEVRQTLQHIQGEWQVGTPKSSSAP